MHGAREAPLDPRSRRVIVLSGVVVPRVAKAPADSYSRSHWALLSCTRKGVKLM